MLDIFNQLNTVLWGPVTLILFMGTGLFLLVRLKGLPIRKAFYALGLLFKSGTKDEKHGEISSFQALMTSLAACIGTGNITGVAMALILGGPGALVWMNISALLGLSTAFTEGLLTMLYRKKRQGYGMCGGPMYVMAEGIGGYIGKGLGLIFALLTVGSSFGMGNMVQSNAAAVALHDEWSIPEHITGLLIALITLFIIVGGIKSVGRFCGIFVPVAGIIYIGCCFLVMIVHRKELVSVLLQMFESAFTLRAVGCGVGGALNISMIQAIKWGVARGVFSNEAGLGSAPIASAAALCDQPVRQAYIQMTGPILDTMIMCTLTGIAILSSGCLGICDDNGVFLTGTALTTAAFGTVLGRRAGPVISMSMLCFAIPTIIGWAYYGEKAIEFLTDKKSVLWAYKIIYSMIAFIGSIRHMEAVWAFSDMMNALMAIPNLLTLLILNSKAVEAVRIYRENNC